MSLGAGIAIAGIWLGVGMCAFGGVGQATAMVAFFAAGATLGVAAVRRP